MTSGHLLPRVASLLQFMCHAWDTNIPSHAWHLARSHGCHTHVASNIKFTCHAWAKIPRVARHFMKPYILACFHSPPPAWFSYHTWPNAARSVRPPPGACATRGMHAARSAPYLAHVPRVASHRTRRPLAVHVPHVACTPHAPPLPAHVPRVASHRTLTARAAPRLAYAPSGLLLNSASLHLLSPHK